MSAARIVTRAPRGEATGCPMLFVHGAWHGAWCWEEHFLDRFAAAGHEVHAIDLRGHGPDAGAGLRTATIGDYVRDVAEVMRGLPTSTVLVGHSMGGYIVQRFLAGRRSGPAVLLAPAPPTGVWGATLRVGGRDPAGLVRSTATFRMWPIVADRARARELFFDPDLPDELAERYLDRLQDESYAAYLGMFRPIPTRRVRSPVLVIGASEDRIFSRGDLTRTARAYGTEPVVIEGAGHDLMLSLRWEQVADEIERWLGGEACADG